MKSLLVLIKNPRVVLILLVGIGIQPLLFYSGVYQGTPLGWVLFGCYMGLMVIYDILYWILILGRDK